MVAAVSAGPWCTSPSRTSSRSTASPAASWVRRCPGEDRGDRHGTGCAGPGRVQT
ncbi:hypothetical protein QJS66_10610 [Kocuria rhizophila]|nr:hypothetical protein QJS66_10610 [Kocuria rhizophila]